MKQHSILNIISTLGIVFWFLFVIALSGCVVLFVLSQELREKCGSSFSTAINDVYEAL